MKKLFFVLASFLISISAAQAQSSKPKSQKTVEGEKVKAVTVKMSGFEMSEGLSEDGMSLIKVAYKWYAGIGSADDKQFAIEIAQREAYATISRIIENAVSDRAEKGAIANNGKVLKALKSHWEQMSYSLQKGCEPFGDVTLEYNKKTQMYEAIAKVGIRGDKFNNLMKQAAEDTPADLSGDDLQQFIDENNSIIDAVKGN